MKAVIFQKDDHVIKYIINNCRVFSPDHIEGDEMAVCGLNLNRFDYVIVDDEVEAEEGQTMSLESFHDYKAELLETPEQKIARLQEELKQSQTEQAELLLALVQTGVI